MFCNPTQVKKLANIGILATSPSDTSEENARGVLVSLAAVFWMSRNAPSVSFGEPLRDIQKMAARETRGERARKCLK